MALAVRARSDTPQAYRCTLPTAPTCNDMDSDRRSYIAHINERGGLVSVNKIHWLRKFSKFPSWLCPRCQTGSLAIDDSSLKIVEPSWSSDGRSHDAWEPEWIDERFCCLLACQNRQCGEIVAVGGSAEHSEDHNWDLQEMNWSRIFLPQTMIPGPPIFPIPEQCPEGVALVLRKAFPLYWSDPASCANRLRVAVETLLTHQGVARTTLNKRRKREQLSLHSRIEKFKIKNREAASYLLAIKWLGNAGSHASLNEIDDEDLIGGFELIEHVIDIIYVMREKRLNKIARSINQRKGKPIRRHSAF